MAKRATAKPKSKAGRQPKVAEGASDADARVASDKRDPDASRSSADGERNQAVRSKSTKNLKSGARPKTPKTKPADAAGRGTRGRIRAGVSQPERSIADAADARTATDQHATQGQASRDQPDQTIADLRRELQAARDRIADLETRHAQALDRINWALDTLRSVQEKSAHRMAPRKAGRGR